MGRNVYGPRGNGKSILYGGTGFSCAKCVGTLYGSYDQCTCNKKKEGK